MSSFKDFLSDFSTTQASYVPCPYHPREICPRTCSHHSQAVKLLRQNATEISRGLNLNFPVQAVIVLLQYPGEFYPYANQETIDILARSIMEFYRVHQPDSPGCNSTGIPNYP